MPVNIDSRDTMNGVCAGKSNTGGHAHGPSAPPPPPPPPPVPTPMLTPQIKDKYTCDCACLVGACMIVCCIIFIPDSNCYYSERKLSTSLCHG